MNVMKEIERINEYELSIGYAGINNTTRVWCWEFWHTGGDSASWHEKYNDSAYVFIGGLDFSLTEGDIIQVFSQFGEVVDCNLVRDQDTGTKLHAWFHQYWFVVGF